MDKSSGRTPQTNAGSDSAKHHTGTASEQHARTTQTARAEVVTGKQTNGYHGNGQPPKADDSSDVK